MQLLIEYHVTDIREEHTIKRKNSPKTSRRNSTQQKIKQYKGFVIMHRKRYQSCLGVDSTKKEDILTFDTMDGIRERREKRKCATI